MTDPDYNLTDELSRKTLDAVASLLTDIESGAVTRPQGAVAIKTLFMAVSGLVESECFDLISEASRFITESMELDKARRLFIKTSPGLELVLLEYQHGEAGVTIKRAVNPNAVGAIDWTQSKSAKFDHEINPFEAAHERYIGYARALLKQGFTEVE